VALTAPTPDEWRTQQAIVLQQADAAVIRLLKRAQRDINAQLREVRSRPAGIGRDIREAQLQLVRRNLSQELGKTWRALGDLVEARRAEAVARSINYQKQLDTFKLVSAGVPGGAEVAENIARAEAAQSSQGIDRMIARTSGASYVPLSRRVYNSNVGINSQVDRMVNSALARGLSVDEFAREVEQFINPNTPGGVRYAALRLARTEINNAAHAQAVSSVQGQPWIKKMKWNLSRSHSRRDICNELAEGGPYGNGTYDKTAVPMKPHPQCFCFPTAVDEESDDDFLDDLLGGEYDDYLDNYRGEPNPTPTPVAPAPPPQGPSTPPSQPPRPGAAPSTDQDAIREEIRTLEERLRTGVVREEPIGVGTATRVTLLTLGDRSRAIRKLAKLKSKLRNGVEMQDAEELASLLGRRIDIRVPEVVREDSLTIVMDFEEGRTPASIANIDDRRQAMAAYGADNPDVIRAALFDFMIVNTDRNNDNFILSPDGGLALIDHGMAFNVRSDVRVAAQGPGFFRYIAGEFDKYEGEFMGPSDRYSREDIEYLRQQLAAMRPEFERLGRIDWFERSNENLNLLEENARGNSRVFPVTPEAPVEVSDEDKARHAQDLIASGKPLPEVIAELRNKYGLTNGQALIMWQKANRKHKAEQAANTPRPVVAMAPARGSASVTGNEAWPERSDARLETINQLSAGGNREQISRELRRQNALVPSSVGQLEAVSMASHSDRVRAGSMSSLAWYQPWDRRVFLGSEIFEDRYENQVWSAERSTNWCSRTGHSHTGAQAVFAHEFGHHVHNMIERLPYAERRDFYRSVSEALGVTPPAGATRQDLNRWMDKNKSAIIDQISKYGATDMQELLAEAWQEYSTSGEGSRPSILAIGKLMQDLAEKGAGK
jgi:hypothetical protein